MQRKVIQIAIAPAYDETVPDILYGLTQDGEIYFKTSTEAKWTKVIAIDDNTIDTN